MQDEASITPAATRVGFSTAPRLQVGNVHGRHSVAATIRLPEVKMTAITRGWLCWDDYSISPRGKGPFRGNTHEECGVLRDLLISTAAVSENSVCGTPVGSKARDDVQTVARHICSVDLKPGDC